MTNGWIKLHRKIKNNPIYSNSKAVHIWLECLIRATHEGKKMYLKRQKIQLKPGEFVCGWDELGRSASMSGSTARYWIKQFEVEGMVESKSSNKGTVISIKNWEDYQKVESKVEDRKKTDEKQMKTNKNVKNVKKDISNTNTQSDKRNKKVSYLIKAYKSLTGYSPTDQKPRFEAWNLLRRIKGTYKDLGKEFTQESFERHVKAYVQYLGKNDWASSMQHMRTFRLKYKLFQEDVVKCQS